MKADSTDKRVPSFIQFTDTNSSSQSSKRRSARLANAAKLGTKRRKTRANALPSTSSALSRRHRIPLKENDNDPENDHYQQTPSIKDGDDPVTAKIDCDMLNGADNNHHECNKAEESAKENDHSNDIDDETVVDMDFNHQSHPISSKSPNRNDEENPCMPPIDRYEPDKQDLTTTTTISTPHRILEFKTITISPIQDHQTTIPPPPPPPRSPSPSLLAVSPPTSPLITIGETCSLPPVVYYTPLRTDLFFEQDTPSQSISDDDYYSAEDDSDWDI